MLRRNCVIRSKWQGAELICSCGRRIALRYQIGDEIRVFVFDRFQKFANRIKEREDTYQIFTRKDLLGCLDDQEWKILLRRIHW